MGFLLNYTKFWSLALSEDFAAIGAYADFDFCAVFSFPKHVGAGFHVVAKPSRVDFYVFPIFNQINQRSHLQTVSQQKFKGFLPSAKRIYALLTPAKRVYPKTDI
jgi:hypothetical protein